MIRVQMTIDEQVTMPLPVISPLNNYLGETSEERYKRLKDFSDTTGIRLLFVYLIDEGMRKKANGERLHFPQNHVYSNKIRT